MSAKTELPLVNKITAGAAIAVMAALFILYPPSSKTVESASPVMRAAETEPLKLTVNTWQKLRTPTLGCAKYEDLDKVRDLSFEGDLQAAASYGMLHCNHFDEGAVIYVEHASPFYGALQVRPKGQPQSYWIIDKTAMEPARP
jgi:hypothetical protein